MVIVLKREEAFYYKNLLMLGVFLLKCGDLRLHWDGEDLPKLNAKPPALLYRSECQGGKKKKRERGAVTLCNGILAGREYDIPLAAGGGIPIGDAVYSRPVGENTDGTAGGGGHGAVALGTDIFAGREYGKRVRFGLHRNGPISRLE